MKGLRETTKLLKANSVHNIEITDIAERAKASLFNSKDLTMYENKILYPISIEVRIKAFQHEI